MVIRRAGITVSFADSVTIFGTSFSASSFGYDVFLKLISSSCWEIATVADVLTGDDSAIGGASTPPELDED